MDWRVYKTRRRIFATSLNATRTKLWSRVAVCWRNCNNTATNPAGCLDAREQSVDIFFSACPTRWCTVKRFQFQLSATVRQYIIRGWPSVHAVHTPPEAILCTKLFACLFWALHTDWCVIRPARQWLWLQHVASSCYLASHLCFGCGCNARV